MRRIYELTYVVDPRASDDEVASLTDDYKKMIANADGEVVREESWGRRRLAYPINKLNEGRYVLLYIAADGTNPCLEVEHRMRQNDKILRYLTDRTDREVEVEQQQESEPTSEEA